MCLIGSMERDANPGLLLRFCDAKVFPMPNGGLDVGFFSMCGGFGVSDSGTGAGRCPAEMRGNA